MTALIPALAGALIVAGVIGVAVGLHPTPPKAPAPTKALPGVTRLSSVSRRTRMLLLVGAAVGFLRVRVAGTIGALLGHR